MYNTTQYSHAMGKCIEHDKMPSTKLDADIFATVDPASYLMSTKVRQSKERGEMFVC
jgi:hypothetical protein